MPWPAAGDRCKRCHILIHRTCVEAHYKEHPAEPEGVPTWEDAVLFVFFAWLLLAMFKG